MTAWTDPPEIEPLAGARWHRIERELFAELDARGDVPSTRTHARATWRPWSSGQRAVWLGFAAAAAAAVLAVLVTRGGESSRGVEPSRVVTAESPARITVGRATLEIAPRSALWVHSGSGGDVAVLLERGQVACAVARLDDGAGFAVHAGDVRVEVTGTVFAVSRHDAIVEVTVSEGEVRVIHAGETATVPAGERWHLGAPDPRAELGTPGPAGTPSGSLPDASENVREDGREDVREDVNEKRRDGPAQDASLASEARGDASGGDGTPTRGHAGRASTRRAPASAAQVRDRRYEEAAQLEASDPAAAIAIYRQLVREGGPWAATALYAHARLEVERGDRRGARALLRRYLDRYPSGPNAADARVLLRRIE